MSFKSRVKGRGSDR